MLVGCAAGADGVVEEVVCTAFEVEITAGGTVVVELSTGVTLESKDLAVENVDVVVTGVFV